MRHNFRFTPCMDMMIFMMRAAALTAWDAARRLEFHTLEAAIIREAVGGSKSETVRISSPVLMTDDDNKSFSVHFTSCVLLLSSYSHRASFFESYQPWIYKTLCSQQFSKAHTTRFSWCESDPRMSEADEKWLRKGKSEINKQRDP